VVIVAGFGQSHLRAVPLIRPPRPLPHGRPDAPDQVLPAPAEALGDLRRRPGQGVGRQVKQQRAVQGRGELGGQDVQVGGTGADLAEQEPDVRP
jgi:hypothetical protein